MSLDERLAALARSLQGERTVAATLSGIAHAAVETVPGAQLAGITQVRGRRAVRTTAATDELVCRVDEAQYDLGEGPCLDSLYRRDTERLPDTAAAGRWPRFARRAAELGIGSMLALQLYVERDELGALNLYAREPGAFGAESERVGRLFAAHAAVAVADAQRLGQLAEAADVRDLVGQAKGILMERHRLTADAAFRLLVRASQATNARLTEVAQRLVDTGTLPGRS